MGPDKLGQGPQLTFAAQHMGGNITGHGMGQGMLMEPDFGAHLGQQDMPSQDGDHHTLHHKRQAQIQG